MGPKSGFLIGRAQGVPPYYWTRKRPTEGQGATFIITKMAVFTLETYYSCETGYPFDDSCQIGNTS